MNGFFSVAVPFVPNGHYTLDSIRIPLTAYASGMQTPFTIEVREGDVEPGAVLERVSVRLSGFSVANARSSQHPLLAAGKQYWVVVSTEGSSEWGFGGVNLSRGKVTTRNTQSSPWSEVSPPHWVPGLYVSGTPATATSSPIQFGNGGSIPHVVAGGGWQTTFVLVNTATTMMPVQLIFWDSNGSPLPMPLYYPHLDRSWTVASTEVAVPAGATITITASDTGALRQGWANLSASGGVEALAIIRSNTSGQETGLTVENRNSNSYLLAFDNNGGIKTGIAIANLADLAIDVPVVIRDDDGAVMERTTVSLMERGHTSFDLTDKFAATKDRRGTIEITTPEFGRISVIGLRFAPSGSGSGLSLTAMPVLAK